MLFRKLSLRNDLFQQTELRKQLSHDVYQALDLTSILCLIKPQQMFNADLVLIQIPLYVTGRKYQVANRCR